jgi:hypothetical protein
MGIGKSRPTPSESSVRLLRERVHQILIRTGSEWAKRSTNPFDGVLKGAPCEDSHLMTFCHACDPKHWIGMAQCGRRGDYDFHMILFPYLLRTATVILFRGAVQLSGIDRATAPISRST